MSEMSDYITRVTKPLTDSLGTELPSNNDPESLRKLKEITSYVEAQRVALATIKRRVDVVVNERQNELAGEFNIKHLNDQKQPTSVERERWVKAHMADELANQKYLDNLQDIIKGKVSLAQSFLRSMQLESEAGNNNNQLRSI